MDRKKELKQQYKQMKPEMGIVIIRCTKENKCYLDWTRNIKSFINSTQFKLDAGGHPNRQLQNAFKTFGPASFSIEVLETLEYDKDESKTDYEDDLILLKMIWEEKLAKINIEFYAK